MMKKMLAAIISATMLSLTGSMLPADALETQPHELTESEALELVCAELGISDFDAYVADLAARLNCDADSEGTRDNCPFDPDDYIDIYTGGSSNGRIDSADSIFLLQFLNGTVNYPYVLSDLDPNQDQIIDRADAQALLDCFAQVIVLEMYPDFVPGTHGATRTIDTGFENRSYWKYNVQTHTVSNSAYTLTLPSAILSVTPENTCIRSALIPDEPDSYVQSFDDRVVKVNFSSGYGTGFIVGEHIIATCGHCVCSIPSTITNTPPSSSEFKITGVTAYQYSSDGSQTPLSLTVKRVHVPDRYIRWTTTDDKKNYDYALIYVQECLITNLGYEPFEMGMFLDGIENEYINGTTNTIVEFTGFPGNSGYAPYPVSSQGWLYYYNEYRFSTKTQNNAGASGSPFYINTMNGNTIYQTVFGIYNSGDSTYANGVIISRPLLQFFVNNPYV